MKCNKGHSLNLTQFSKLGQEMMRLGDGNE